jgi:hypothetical protein
MDTIKAKYRKRSEYNRGEIETGELEFDNFMDLFRWLDYYKGSVIDFRTLEGDELPPEVCAYSGDCQEWIVPEEWCATCKAVN